MKFYSTCWVTPSQSWSSAKERSSLSSSQEAWALKSVTHTNLSYPTATPLGQWFPPGLLIGITWGALFTACPSPAPDQFNMCLSVGSRHQCFFKLSLVILICSQIEKHCSIVVIFFKTRGNFAHSLPQEHLAAAPGDIFNYYHWALCMGRTRDAAVSPLQCTNNPSQGMTQSQVPTVALWRNPVQEKKVEGEIIACSFYLYTYSQKRRKAARSSFQEEDLQPWHSIQQSQV